MVPLTRQASRSQHFQCFDNTTVAYLERLIDTPIKIEKNLLQGQCIEAYTILSF